MIKKLHTKYFFIIFSVLSLYIVFIAAFNYVYIKNQIEENFIELSSRSIGQKGESIQKYTSLIEKTFKNISNDTDLRTQLSSDTFNKELAKLLRTYTLTVPGVSQIRVLTHRNELYSGTGTKRYENEAFMSKSYMGWSIYQSTTDLDSNSLYYTTKIYNNFYQTSYLIIEVDTAFLRNITHPNNATWSDMTLIYHHTALALYSTGDTTNAYFNDLEAPSKLIYSAPHLETTLIKNDYIHSYQFDELPLHLMTTVPTSAIKNRSIHLLIIIALVSQVLIFLSALFSLAICNLIWNPLRKISHRFNTEYGGDL
ncbi:MAG: hypothetical protein H7X94_10460 [Vallitaleaceae bacterium]|nr:hypothetical protein [Vallitaleaceae bacterium]